MRRALGCLGLLLAVLATPAAPAIAAAKPDPIQVAKAAAARLRAILDHLHQSEWDAAASGARSAIQEHLGSDGWGNLADLVAYLALAEEGMGRHDDAMWHWREARNLGTTVDPETFGEPGAALAKVSLRQMGEVPADLPVEKSSGDGPPITPPRFVSGAEAKLPESRHSYPPGLHVQAIVDAEGRVHEPVVASTTFPALAYVALEAMRGWRFDPAKANGRPVASFYELQLPAPRPLDKVSVIDESGMIRDPVLLRNGPTLGFDASVLDAYCEWRFKPALVDGKPAKVRYTFTVNFEIR